MEKFWSLANINVYKILCPPKLKGYNDAVGKKYSKEDVIYFEKNKDYNVYLVSGGKVKLINYDENGNEIVRQIITKGGLFGESLILGTTERNEYAVACDNNTAVCSMNLETMKDLMRKNENFSTAIYKMIGLKIKKIERRLDMLVGKDVKSRVACYLYDRYEEEGTSQFPNHLSQKELASILAATRESINKVYKDLRNSSIVEITRKHIKILDPDQLKKMSE
ncbi:MAG: Crp/Fnr family transcriptional regulator [Bacteroidota bacterium]